MFRLLSALLLALVGLRVPSPAVEVETIAEFYPSPLNAIEALVAGADGRLHGITNYGGDANTGAIFRMETDGQMTVLWSFGAQPAPAVGYSPTCGLALGADGAFYGMTSVGGALGHGAIFRYRSTGMEWLADLDSPQLPGRSTFAPLTRGSDGALYGATTLPGATTATDTLGCLFRLTADGTVTILASATVAPSTLPAGVMAEGMFLAPDGALYGGTSRGDFFRIPPTGTVEVLVRSTGLEPAGLMAIGSDGAMYGTSVRGGANDAGAIYRIGADGVVTTVASFTGTDGALPGRPDSGLVVGPGDDLYGMASQGGYQFAGILFKYSITTGAHLVQELGRTTPPGRTSGAPLVRRADGTLLGIARPNFPYDYFSLNQTFEVRADGSVGPLTAVPLPVLNVYEPTFCKRLLPGPDGNFYGFTTSWRAPQSVYNQCVFRLLPDGTVQTVNRFTPSAPSLSGNPAANFLFFAQNGMAYGLAEGAGTPTTDALFRIDPATGDKRVIASSAAGSPELSVRPRPPSVERSGSLYGICYGGTEPYGGVYKIPPDGATRMLAFFTPKTGALPGSLNYGRMTQGNDGSLYGTAAAGGLPENHGTVYRVTPDDQVVHVASFTGQSGALPGSFIGDFLTEGSDGALYGTTYFGGSANLGVIFRMEPGQMPTTLAEFTGTGGALPGHSPNRMIRGDDGRLYGITSRGGAADAGTVFRVRANGTTESLAAFTGVAGALPGTSPTATLEVSFDGRIYGTTGRGGAQDRGTLFRIRANGSVEHLASFTDAQGSLPGESAYGLAVRPNDAVYGVTRIGGANGTGIVFRIAPDGQVTRFMDLPAMTPSQYGYSAKISCAPDQSLWLTIPRTNTTPGKILRLNPARATAVNDTFELVATPLPITANDTLDEQGDPGVIAAISQPNHGAATLLADRTVQYTPGASFTGSDTFTYMVSDRSGFDSTATVTIRDTQAPTFTPLAARTLAVGTNGQLALPDLRAELAATDLGGVGLIEQSPPPGTLRGLGAHTVSFQIGDRAGNVATTSTVITVADLNGPAISVPPLLFIDLAEGETALVPDLLPLATVTDDVGVASITQQPPAGTTATGNQARVVLSALDLVGNASTAACEIIYLNVTAALPTGALTPAGEEHEVREYGPPAINGAGYLGFRAKIGGPRRPGIFQFATAPLPRAIALVGNSAPGTKGRFASFSDPSWSDSNHAAFRAALRLGTGGVTALNDTGVWVGGPDDITQLVAREGDNAPGLLPAHRFTRFESVALLPDGRVVFTATTAPRGGSKPGAPRRGLWITQGDDLILVLAEGDALSGHGQNRVRSFQLLAPTPGVSGQTRSFRSTGEFAARIRLTGSSDIIATLTPDVAGTQVQTWAVTGELSSLGHTWQRLGDPALAEDGALAFRAESGTDPAATSPGVFAIDSDDALHAVAHAGDPAPGVTGATFADFGAPVIVDEDTLAFSARLSGPDAGANDSLWRSAAGTLALVAREGDAAPGATDYTFGAFPSFAQRANGRLLFLATLQRPGARPVRAIYAETATGLELIAREGGELDYDGTARRVTALDFLPTLPVVAGQTRSFGASDHLVFRASLDQVRTPVLYRRKLAP